MTSRTAVIVGGTSGIGLATARLLTAQGVSTHIVGRSRERLDAIAGTDPTLVGHQADGGDAEQVAAMFAAIGQLDWLIVTLSGSDGAAPIAALDLGMLRRAFDAKFWAHLTTIQASLPHLTREGSITVIGAVTARAGMPGTAGIAAINGAVEALVRPLAVELAPIRVNAVSPGLVDTPWWSAFPDDVRAAYFAQMAAQLPSRAVATAEDVAEAVVLVATNKNITGTILEADGGARLVSLG
jgi:NAD(P)-dependent dehydrogenase (short-subunit alcohol dehydrogenase family)